jgi:hypothetical protein
MFSRPVICSILIGQEVELTGLHALINLAAEV